MEALNFILSQPHSSSLRLSIESAPGTLVYSEYALQMLETLVSHSACWSQVSLWLDLTCYSKIRRIKHHLSKLKAIDLYSIDKDLVIPASTFEGIFEDAPQLVSVTLVNIDNILDMDFPWERITEFTVGCPKGKYTDYQVLSRMPNIITFGWVDADFSPPSPRAPTAVASTIYRPHLQTLAWDVIFTPIPEALVAPNLCTLRLESETTDHETKVQQLMSLICRSSCQLSLIDLDLGTRWPAKGAQARTIELFEALPNLIRLEIGALDPSVILRLCPSNNSLSTLLPKLRDLAIGICSQAEIEALNTMVRSRAAFSTAQQSKVTRLQSCIVETPLAQDPMLAKLEEDGMCTRFSPQA